MSDIIQQRRRYTLLQVGQSQQANRNQQAIYACQARGTQVEAAYTNLRCLLNLEAAVAGVQARSAFIEAYQWTSGF